MSMTPSGPASVLPPVRRQVLVVGLAAAVACEGAGVLLGWAGGASWLLAASPAGVPMMPATAAALLAAGLGLLALAWWPSAAGPRVAAGLAGFMGLVGVLTLASYATGRDLGLDDPMLAVLGYGAVARTGFRPAFLTALAMVLLALALGARALVPARPDLRCAPAVLAAAIAYLVGLAHAFGVPVDLALVGPVHMAELTVVGFLLASGAALLLDPPCAVVALLAAPGPGGAAARRMLPFLLFAPLVLGAMRYAFEGDAWLAGGVGLSLMMFGFTCGALGLVWWGAKGIERAWAAEQRRERDLAAATRRQAEILDRMPVVVALKDLDGRYRFVNREFERVTGRPRDVVLGRSTTVLGASPNVARTQARDAEVLARREGVTYEDQVERPDGTHTFWVHRFPLLDEAGAPLGIVSLSQDVTERVRLLQATEAQRAALEQAQEVQRMKDHLLSTLSHELKTPLALVTGYAELLAERYPADELLGGLVDGARRIDEHVGRMIDLAALVGGSMPLYRAPVDAAEIFEIASARLPARADAHEPRVEVVIAPALPPILGDQRRLVQVVEELLGNAIRHGGPRPRVYLEASADEGGQVVLGVCDEGPGLPPEALRLIWEPFGQAELEDARRAGGLGIGLAIVRRLVELHGGRIEVACGPDGACPAVAEHRHRGCCFRVHLPAAPV